MSRRLPPLNAIRAFEAAARHLSFARAAEELFVTAAAISQQVRQLEEWLGLPLFHRLARGVLLTEAGQLYAPLLTELLDRMAEATRLVASRDPGDVVTISAMPSLCAGWLVPRLPRLKSLHPDIELRIEATMELTDFSRQAVDLVIRYGTGDWPGLFVEPLMADEVFAVCSPALLERGPPLQEPADLRHHTLLHDDVHKSSLEPSWPHFLHYLGQDGIDATRGPRFTYTHMTLQAAATGQGVALASQAFIGQELELGRLVKPFPQTMPGPGNYYLACPPRHAERPQVAALRGWLRAEGAATLLYHGRD